MKQIAPCKDCICFSICRSILIDKYDKHYPLRFNHKFDVEIKRKCILIKEYLNNDNNISYCINGMYTFKHRWILSTFDIPNTRDKRITGSFHYKNKN